MAKRWRHPARPRLRASTCGACLSTVMIPGSWARPCMGRGSPGRATKPSGWTGRPRNSTCSRRKRSTGCSACPAHRPQASRSGHDPARHQLRVRQRRLRQRCRCALDLDRGWIDYPRPKTGIARRCPLWPETVAALRAVLADAPDAEGRGRRRAWCSSPKYGHSWAKDIAGLPITKEMRKLLDELGIDGHRNFYALRHTFRDDRRRGEGPPAVNSSWDTPTTA